MLMEVWAPSPVRNRKLLTAESAEKFDEAIAEKTNSVSSDG